MIVCVCVLASHERGLGQTQDESVFRRCSVYDDVIPLKALSGFRFRVQGYNLTSALLTEVRSLNTYALNR